MKEIITIKSEDPTLLEQLREDLKRYHGFKVAQEELYIGGKTILSDNLDSISKNVNSRIMKLDEKNYNEQLWKIIKYTDENKEA